MALDHWRIPASPEEASIDKIRGLERDLAAKRRNSQLPNLQRGYVLNPNTTSGVVSGAGTPPGTAIGTSLALNIPSVDVRITWYWQVVLNVTISGTTAALWLYEPTDFPNGLQLLNGATPAVTPATSVFQPTFSPAGTGYVVTSGLQFIGSAPTPGDRVYSLRLGRTAGTGSVAVSNSSMWMTLI